MSLKEAIKNGNTKLALECLRKGEALFECDNNSFPPASFIFLGFSNLEERKYFIKTIFKYRKNKSMNMKRFNDLIFSLQVFDHAAWYE